MANTPEEDDEVLRQAIKKYWPPDWAQPTPGTVTGTLLRIVLNMMNERVHELETRVATLELKQK